MAGVGFVVSLKVNKAPFLLFVALSELNLTAVDIHKMLQDHHDKVVLVQAIFWD